MIILEKRNERKTEKENKHVIKKQSECGVELRVAPVMFIRFLETWESHREILCVFLTFFYLFFFFFL